MWRLAAGTERTILRLALGAATTLAPVCMYAPAAGASCPQPLEDRYDPGEVVTIVGYSTGCLAVATRATARDERPLYGYLHPDPCTEVSGTRCRAIRSGYGSLDDPTSGLPLGRFAIDETTQEWRGLRMSLTFRLPTDLPRGAYVVAICRDPCSQRPGKVGQWLIHVGVDPSPDRRPVRHWPLDDPSVQDLPDKARLVGYDGQEITAAEVRAGITIRNPARPQNRAPADPSVRTDAPTQPDNNGQVVLWLAGMVLLILLLGALSRLGPTRKHIHH